MLVLNFVHLDGHEDRLVCTEGMSVLECALHYGIAGIRGRCGGIANCGTCHCRVLGSWMQRLAPPGAAEAEQLDSMDEATDDSRLACQIRMTRALNGLRVQWMSPGPTEGAA